LYAASDSVPSSGVEASSYVFAGNVQGRNATEVELMINEYDFDTLGVTLATLVEVESVEVFAYVGDPPDGSASISDMRDAAAYTEVAFRSASNPWPMGVNVWGDALSLPYEPEDFDWLTVETELS